MKRIDRILIGLAVAMLLTVPAAAQKVSHDVAEADFTGMKTFAFKDSRATDSTADKSTYDPVITEQTNAAIAAQLEARGLRQVDRNPDVYVSTRRVFKTEYTVTGSPYWNGNPYWWGGLGYAFGWSYDPYYTGWGPSRGAGWYTTIDERTIGTLVVDVEDAATGQLMWRGLAQQHVHEHASPEHRSKRVNKAVDKMFEKFPR